MSYSCVDFADEVLETLIQAGLIQPDDLHADDPEAQATLAVGAIRDLLVSAVEPRKLAALLASVTEALDNCLAHAGKPMAAADMRQRTALVAEARALLYGPPAEDDDYPPACTNPGGHLWNRSAGEADEARLSGNYSADNIRCVYCDADGDA
jgi:hypothetical protein